MQNAQKSEKLLLQSRIALQDLLASVDYGSPAETEKVWVSSAASSTLLLLF